MKIDDIFKAKKERPLPPAFKPNIIIRFSDSRDKTTHEIRIDVPLTMAKDEISKSCHECLDLILIKAGYKKEPEKVSDSA